MKCYNEDAGKYNDDEDVIGAYDYEAKMKLIADIEKEEAIKEKFELGSNQRTIEIVRNILKENIDINVISKVIGLNSEQIDALR